MTNQAQRLYDLNLNEAVQLIKAIGHKRTVLVQGHMGSGKSSMLTMLGDLLPNHAPCYVDCTTKEPGDLGMPVMKIHDGQDFVRMAPSEELGFHLGHRPLAILIDEFGKAERSVQLSLLRPMLERKSGNYTLHPDTVIFATTNLGAEGVGDLLKPHARNRLVVVRVKKATHMEWIEWGINNNVHPIVLGFAKDNPQLFQSFEDVTDPEENPDIYHPRSTRTAFVTQRSLEAASDIFHLRGTMSDATLTAALMGTIGDNAALNLMAFAALSNDLPTLASIKRDPLTAKVPATAAGVCMVVYRTLCCVEEDWIDNWMVYLDRLDTEAQGLFANGARAVGYSRQNLVMTNEKFTAWARSRSHLFAADI